MLLQDYGSTGEREARILIQEVVRGCGGLKERYRSVHDVEVGKGLRRKGEREGDEAGDSYPSQSFFYCDHLLFNHHHQLDPLFIAHGDLTGHVANIFS